jgi:hypothetical protein
MSHEPTLDYRGKNMSRPLFEFQLISQPPKQDLFFLIRTLFLAISLLVYFAGGIHFRIGTTLYACISHHGILLMHMHPNYAERFPALALGSRLPEFVATIQSFKTWPYAQWTKLPLWPALLPWAALLALTWRLTRLKKTKPAPEPASSCPIP